MLGEKRFSQYVPADGERLPGVRYFHRYERRSSSVYASLIPIVDRIKSLGIVSIPGLMAGMIIAGANPIYTAQYQVVIMLLLFAAGALTSVASTALVSRRVFIDAKQLDDRVVDAIEG